MVWIPNTHLLLHISALKPSMTLLVWTYLFEHYINYLLSHVDTHRLKFHSPVILISCFYSQQPVRTLLCAMVTRHAFHISILCFFVNLFFTRAVFLFVADQDAPCGVNHLSIAMEPRRLKQLPTQYRWTYIKLSFTRYFCFIIFAHN